MPKGTTAAVERLGLLLQALTDQWEDQWEIVARVGVYPELDKSARTMFNRDLRWLKTLGFVIERTRGHHRPAFRLAGHTRWKATITLTPPEEEAVLTPRQQEIVSLHDEQGLTWATIGRALSMTPQAAQSTYQRAKGMRHER